jgi:NhaP-type Na+/H+ or K+/H+ antiporter
VTRTALPLLPSFCRTRPFHRIITFAAFLSIGAGGAYLFVAAVILLVRRVALVPALAGSKLNRLECAAIMWFGPKGFASLVFAFIILNAGVQKSREMFELIGLVVVASILAHSSTDVMVARSFKTRETRVACGLR